MLCWPFEEDMLLQLFNSRVATAAGVELTTQQQSAAQSLSQFFQVTKAASDRNQRVALQTKVAGGLVSLLFCLHL